MFAKIAAFRVMTPQRAHSAVAPAHCNDNKINTRGSAAVRRPRRPVLACRWRPTAGGGLECYWDIEVSDGSATAEPDRRWSISRICRLAGVALMGHRLPLPALG